ncbi:GNAT family N-acetyltransferase [Microvirga lotononidis]|uniref:Acetyltransferase, ribosomal protein N-acetylase n=1 Tax=Microvirga lotononidis TaxID=864069 RepID=I4YQI9_9HYPH|nr:GNAT family protein [Microvirga lotononidis]EIM26231.1 acetyltransferase, ribosomal protein N-acetylase [Microvirga lotononidis]WQO30616.1 GNAT family protein [Microvirga lotononidis]
MQLEPIPVLEGRGITLRKAQSSDVEARLRLGNDPDIVEMFGVSQDAVRPPTPESAARWVQTLMDHPRAWVIATDRLIGEVRLDRIDRQDRRASLAIGILDPQCLGKGLGTQAIMLVLGHAFHDLKLHRIGVRVLAYNTRAIRAYQKCGFQIEGREREAAFVDGQWHDDVIMGLLEHEFTAGRVIP